VIREALDRQHAVEILHQKPKGLRMLEVPERIDLALMVAGVRSERGGELVLPRLPLWLGE
jgi:hypothetical protein